jgi:hypothetical protein
VVVGFKVASFVRRLSAHDSAFSSSRRPLPRAKAVAGLDEVTRAALEAAQAQTAEESGLDNVVELAGRRRRAR